MIKNLVNDRIGKTSKNNLGSLMEITEYKDANNIFVKFLIHGNIVKTTWRQFCNGQVKNPFDKSVYGIGYIGEGRWKVKENGKCTSQYLKWRGMIERCYVPLLQNKHPTYKGCSVSEEWHNFQTFAKWYDENYYEIDGEIMCLDKDILVKGNKVYSPDTAVFVPKRINLLFIKNDAGRGKFPIGVSWDKRDKKIVAQCSNGKNQRILLGYYNTTEDAFLSYKKFKEKLIKQIAGEYRSKIPSILYEAMIKYEVEITD